MSRELRIVMLIGSMQEGGAEGQLLQLMRGLRLRGHDVRLILLRPEGALLPRVMEEGIPIYGVGLPRLRPIFGPRGKFETIRCLVRTVTHLRNFQPHIYQCFLFEAEAWGWLTKLLGAPGLFLTSRRNLGVYKSTSPWKQTIQDLYNRSTTLVIANARAVARDALKREKNLTEDMLRVVYNCVNAERFATAVPADLREEYTQLKSASHLVVSVANLFEYKGYFDLIEAWKNIHKQFPDAHLLCVGRDAEIGGEMRARINAAGLDKVIHLLGARNDIPNVLRACDVAVLASHEEGQPNAVIEASAAGLPVVATAVGGVPEIIEHRKSGFIVKPHRPDHLARAINGLLVDENRRKDFGVYGQNLIQQRFGMERFIDEFEEIYLSLLTDH